MERMSTQEVVCDQRDTAETQFNDISYLASNLLCISIFTNSCILHPLTATSVWGAKDEDLKIASSQLQCQETTNNVTRNCIVPRSLAATIHSRP